MPINGLRVQAHQFLALALKAHEDGRSKDAYELTAKAMEHLEDALSVEELRRAPRPSRKRAHGANGRRA
jgi:DNA-binding PadR family transcriptional regulator